MALVGGDLCRCTGPTPYAGYLGKRAATMAARSHVGMVVAVAVACQHCDEGFEPEVFQCRTDERIWHWGHSSEEE